MGELGFEKLGNPNWFLFLKGKLTRSSVINLYCLLNNQTISALDVLGLNVYPCPAGLKAVTTKIITHRKSTFGVGVTDALPEGEIPISKLGKIYDALKNGYETADMIMDLVGEQVGPSEEYTGCVSPCYVADVETSYHLDSPALDWEQDNYYFGDVILYWYIEKEYKWHSPPSRFNACNGVRCY